MTTSFSSLSSRARSRACRSGVRASTGGGSHAGLDAAEEPHAHLFAAAAVDAHAADLAARAVLPQPVGQQALAGSGLAADQHRAPGVVLPPQGAHHATEGLAVSDQLGRQRRIGCIERQKCRRAEVDDIFQERQILDPEGARLATVVVDHRDRAVAPRRVWDRHAENRLQAELSDAGRAQEIVALGRLRDQDRLAGLHHRVDHRAADLGTYRGVQIRCLHGQGAGHRLDRRRAWRQIPVQAAFLQGEEHRLGEQLVSPALWGSPQSPPEFRGQRLNEPLLPLHSAIRFGHVTSLHPTFVRALPYTRSTAGRQLLRKRCRCASIRTRTVWNSRSEGAAQGGKGGKRGWSDRGPYRL